MSLAIIITNALLVIALGIVGVALLVVMVKDSRPIVIKEAKVLREYYEAKLKDAEKKADDAGQDFAEYKALYEKELQKNRKRESAYAQKIELEKQVERLNKELNSCEDRINDMAQENASLKEQIMALKKPAKKKEGKSGRTKE